MMTMATVTKTRRRRKRKIKDQGAMTTAVCLRLLFQPRDAARREGVLILDEKS
jgi:hypothetical protein